MSLYGNKVKIDGVPCGVIVRGLRNGEYRAVFERDLASLEQVEGINWRRPRLSGPCGLPQGYGFDVANIEYAMGTRCWTVTLKVREQYLGDVTGYQAQIDTLKEDKARLQADKAALAADKTALEDQLAEADETAIALFEELEAARAEPPASSDETEESGEVAE